MSTQPYIFNAKLGKWGRISTEYYLASRQCYFADLLRPAYFSAYHSIECMAKGFLEFKDPKFDGESYGHNWGKIFKELMKHYPKAKFISIPDYMIKEISYLLIKYPKGTLLLAPTNFLDDVDKRYLSMLQLISPIHLKWLEEMIEDKEEKTPGIFTRDNFYKKKIIDYFKSS